MENVKKIVALIDRIGLIYILMFPVCVITVVASMFGVDRSITADRASMYVLILATVVFKMWRGSESGLRTPIAILMVAEGLYSSANAIGHDPYSWATQFAIDIMWLAGVWMMYTGPSLREIVQEVRLIRASAG